jgi:septum site-determining protein MinD
MLSTADVLELLAVDLLGVVPDDDRVITSTNRGIPIVLDGRSLAGQAFRNIAQRLRGENVPIMDLEEQGGFLGRLARLIRQGGN